MFAQNAEWSLDPVDFSIFPEICRWGAHENQKNTENRPGPTSTLGFPRNLVGISRLFKADAWLLTSSCMTCAASFRGRGVRGRGMARFLYFFLRDFCRVLAAGQVRGLDFSRLLASSWIFYAWLLHSTSVFLLTFVQTYSAKCWLLSSKTCPEKSGWSCNPWLLGDFCKHVWSI